MKILLVDDNLTYLTILHGILAHLGDHLIVDCPDPQDALSRAGIEEFDLVLVDYVMPGMNGVEFVRRLRQLSSHRDQPVVMVTAAEQRDVRIAALQAGATDVLRKPIEPVELRARVRNLLSLREKQLILRDQASWLEHEVRRATAELVANQRDLVHRLSHALDCRDGHTGDHVSRMADICREIAIGLGLPEQQVETIHAAAPLHWPAP